MRKYYARDLAVMPEDHLWSLPDTGEDERCIVIFDDGEYECDVREAIYCSYLWGFYADFPETPALKKHALNGRRVGGNTAQQVIDSIRWDCQAAYQGRVTGERLSKKSVEYINALYNANGERLEAYVITLSLEDLMDVDQHPEILEANQAVTSAPNTITNAHRTIERVLKDPNAMPTNMLSRLVRSNLVKIGQVIQTMGPRGSVTDIDSSIFTYPTITGFFKGLYRFYDSLIESRTAAKSLTFTEKPLQDTEYFNRRLQLLAGTFKGIVPGDCGSTSYVEWHMGSDDFKAFLGKHYLSEATGDLYTIVDTEECRRSIIGRTLKIRSPLKCLTTDANSCCSTCYGDMYLSIPEGTNVGHVGATAVCKQASQNVLSTKHLDRDATSVGVRLSEYEQRYVMLGNDQNQIFLAPRLEKKDKVRLVVRSDEAESLTEVRSASSVDLLTLSKISAFRIVAFIVEHQGKEERDVVQISNGSRLSSFSRQMLQYLRDNSWKVVQSDNDDTTNYEVDLSKWDFNDPVFVTPRKQENMLDYMATIERFLKASRKDPEVPSLKDYDTLDSALRGFYELVSSRLFVNIVHLEILVKVCQIRSSKNRDYRIPLHGNAVEFGKFDLNLFYRSAGAGMAYQEHRKQWNSPLSYLIKYRPQHILDPILIPVEDEVVTFDFSDEMISQRRFSARKATWG